MGMVHPCPVCDCETTFLFDEFYQCKRCGRCYGFKNDEIYDKIEKEVNRKKAGRPLGSKNKRRLQRIGLLRKENKDDKKER
jgi:hypothetical protein